MVVSVGIQGLIGWVTLLAGTMPQSFMATESQAWNDWLVTPISTRWIGPSLGDHAAAVSFPVTVQSIPPACSRRTISLGPVSSRRSWFWLMTRLHKIEFSGLPVREPIRFAGVPETEQRTREIGGIEVVTTTRVMPMRRTIYREHAERNTVKFEEQIDGKLYVAMEEDRERPFPNGATATWIVLMRYQVID